MRAQDSYRYEEDTFKARELGFDEQSTMLKRTAGFWNTRLWWGTTMHGDASFYEKITQPYQVILTYYSGILKRTGAS